MTGVRKPGRPRNEATRRAILAAASDLLETGGLGAVTMEAVARRAGVGKPTLYRSWANREALMMAAVMAGAQPVTVVRETGSVRADLKRHLRRVADVFATPRGRQAAQMVASSDPDSELAKAFRTQVMLQSRDEGRALLGRAITAGEARADAIVEITLDLLYGPVYYRLLVGHAPIDGTFSDQLVDAVFSGIQPRVEMTKPGSKFKRFER